MSDNTRISRRGWLVGASAAVGGGAMANALFAEPSNRAGLVAHWPLDDGKGATLRELSSLSARGTCQGTQWASGNGAALEFVPPDGCAHVRTQTARPFELSEAFTLAAWICPTT
ncbi:MAG: hypothetical protein ABFD16_09390, partial [Thermoguttaceae bacterium]